MQSPADPTPDITQQQPENPIETAPTNPRENRPHISVEVGGRAYVALIDTGAAISFIGDRLLQEGGNKLAPVPPPIHTVRLADNSVVTVLSSLSSFRVPMKIGDTVLRENLTYLPNLSTEVVLGMDILSRHDFRMTLSNGAVFLGEQEISKHVVRPVTLAATPMPRDPSKDRSVRKTQKRTPYAVPLPPSKPTPRPFLRSQPRAQDAPALPVTTAPPLIISEEENNRLEEFLNEHLTPLENL